MLDFVGSISSTYTQLEKKTHTIFFCFCCCCYSTADATTTWESEKKNTRSEQHNMARIRNKLKEMLYVLIIGTVCELTFKNLPIAIAKSLMSDSQRERDVMCATQIKWTRWKTILNETENVPKPKAYTAKCSLTLCGNMVWRHNSLSLSLAVFRLSAISHSLASKIHRKQRTKLNEKKN